MKFSIIFKKRLVTQASFVFLTLSGFWGLGCSVFITKPTQELANMDVAIRAARDVHAEELAPENYQNAVEYGNQARREFRLKNYQKAKKLSELSREFAEKAEFQSVKSGGKREELPEDPLAAPGADE